MKRIVSSAALAAAAALTFSLASPVAANASESAGATATPLTESAPAASAPKASATAATGSIRIGTGYISKYPTAGAPTTYSISSPGATDWYVLADVYVNGVKRTTDSVVGASGRNSAAATWPRAAGYGTAQLRNVRVVSYPGGTSTLPNSNVAPVKRTLELNSRDRPKAYFKISKRGSKAKAVLSNWRVYQPNGSLVRGAKAMIIQRKVGKKWKKVKIVKLNSKGKGVTKFSSKKKYKYRAVMKSSATVQGGIAVLPRKI